MSDSTRSGGAAVAPETGPADSLAGARHSAPTVVYIAGTGRSGSTILERALGEIPGFVNVGELGDLYRRDAPRSERCGCGEPLADCSFWSNVGKRVHGGWESEKLAAVERVKNRVVRQRYLPHLFAPPLAGRAFRENLASFGTSYSNLYRAIAEEAGATYVVDASKWPAQALALARAGVDVRMIHLVRDVRGVAYSFAKQGLRRPHALNQTDMMWDRKPAVTAAGWVARQVQTELMRHWGVRGVRVRYEDFVRQPRRTVEAALTGLGISYDPAHLAHLGEDRLMLSTSHGIAGNPSRFREGEITLRPDEAWRQGMSRRDRVLVTLIGLPLIVWYGWYPRRRSPS